MHFSLKCFCDFVDAPDSKRRLAVLKKYKKGITAPAKGMIVYYSPALQLMRKRICPDGTLAEKIATLPDKCYIAKWPERLNQVRLESNVLVFRAFHSHFGDKKLKVRSSPRLQFRLTEDVSISMQPELYAEIDGVPMVWKLGMSKDSPSEAAIRYVLQMLHRSLRQKGFGVPIQHVCYFDVRAGKIYADTVEDGDLSVRLKPAAIAMAKAWASIA